MTSFEQATIICASKYFTVDETLTIYNMGYHHFGENRVDSFLEKYQNLNSKAIIWHFIGHLQTNKSHKVLPYIDYLHTLDSLKLANLIQKYCEKPLKCFIQVNLTEEQQKNGIGVFEIDDFIKNIQKYDKIELVGFMTMGKQNDPIKTREAFKVLSQLKNQYNLPYLSMGMSDDYLIALEENATHLRLGRYFKTLLER
jgi:pyridoxal phosphate enzyme (YggS family)